MEGRALLEREHERAELAALIERARTGRGAAVLVQGEAGIGKSALAHAAAETAQTAGFRVLSGKGGELERELGWGLLRELFTPALDDPDDRHDLLSGAAAAAAPLLGFAAPAPAAAAESVLPEALNGFYWLVSNLCEREPLFLAADDCHWADRPSLQFLAYLAPRVDDLPLLVCTSAHVGEPGADETLDALATRTQPITLEPLSLTASTQLLSEALATTPSEQVAAACHRATGGNPFLLRELAADLQRAGPETERDALALVDKLRPQAVSRAAVHRLAHVPATVQRLACAAAILGDNARLERAAELARLSLEQAASGAAVLVRMSLLADQLPLLWRHPLVHRAIYDEIPGAERALLHARAAGLARQEGDEPERVAAHLLHATRRSDSGVVGILREAAGQAVRRGAPSSAARYLRRALEEPPPPAQRPAVLVELGEAEALAGEVTAPARLQEALPLLDDRRARLQVLLPLGLMLHQAGRFAQAADTLEQGLRELDGTDGQLAGELEALYLQTAWLDPTRAVSVRERVEAHLADRSRPSGQHERALLAAALAQWTFECRSSESLKEVASRLLADGQLLAEERDEPVNLLVPIGFLSWSDQLDEAEALIEPVLERAQSRNSYAVAAVMLYSRSWPRYWRGAIADAVVDAQAAVDAWRGGWAGYLPGAAYWLALAQIELGDLAAAEAALVLDDEERWRQTTAYFFVPAARGRLAAARGDFEAALNEHLHCGEVAAALMLRNPSVVPWRSEAALAAHRIGNDEQARKLAYEEVKLARDFGAARPLGTALRATGIVTGGQRGIALLQDAVRILEASPSQLEYCRALVDLGAALRKAGKRGQAVQPLRAGLDLAHRFGAHALAAQARSELNAMGLRPRRLRLTGPDALTPAELRICNLATEGCTNREIAQRLLLSLRTVETHLTHAYQKLDIDGRSELPNALSQDAAADARPPAPQTS